MRKQTPARALTPPATIKPIDLSLGAPSTVFETSEAKESDASKPQ